MSLVIRERLAQPGRFADSPCSHVSFIPKAMETGPQTIDKSWICLTPSHSYSSLQCAAYLVRSKAAQIFARSNASFFSLMLW
jgi:hypothetical protein